MAVDMKISAVDVSSASYAAKTTVVGQADVPGLSAQEMQTSVEYMPRNLLAPKINELVNAVNASYSKAEADAAINAKVLEIGTGDMAKAVYDASGAVQAAGGIAGYVSGQVSPVADRTTRLEKARTAAVELTAEAWSEKAPYTQTVSVTWVTEDWVPGVPVLAQDGDTTNASDVVEKLEELAKIRIIQSASGSLTFTAPEDKPEKALRLRVPGCVQW